MGLKRYQVNGDRHIVRADWRWYKNQLARWERRQAKRDPEAAPVRRARKNWVA